jgi:hypothetical protein
MHLQNARAKSGTCDRVALTLWFVQSTGATTVARHPSDEAIELCRALAIVADGALARIEKEIEILAAVRDRLLGDVGTIAGGG